MTEVLSINKHLVPKKAKVKTLPTKNPAKKSKPKVAVAKASVWQTISRGALFLLTGGRTVSLTGCGGQEPIPGSVEEQLKDEGVQMDHVAGNNPIPDDSNTDEVPVDPTEDDVELPVDEQGDPILPDDIWYIVEGNGFRFQETPWINFEANLGGANLQNLDLYVEVGTDSTRITFDSDGDGTTDANISGCFDGLINTMQLDPEVLTLTPEERELYGIAGCPETGYESFVVCPSDPGNRLPLYVSEFVIEGYTPDNTLIGEETGPTEAQPVGVVCAGSPGANEINIPEEFYSDGTLNIKFKLRKSVDAVQADANASYQTHLRVRLKAR